MITNNNKEIIKQFLKKGYLLSPDFFDTYNEIDNTESLFKTILEKTPHKEKPL